MSLLQESVRLSVFPLLCCRNLPSRGFRRSLSFGGVGAFTSSFRVPLTHMKRFLSCTIIFEDDSPGRFTVAFQLLSMLSVESWHTSYVANEIIPRVLSHFLSVNTKTEHNEFALRPPAS
jgi:hypothetical protein